MSANDGKICGKLHHIEDKYDKSQNMCLPQNRPASQPETLNPAYTQRLSCYCHLNQLKMNSNSHMRHLLHSILSRELISKYVC